MTYAMFLSSHRLLKVLEIMALAATVLGLIFPRFGSGLFGRVDRWFGWLANSPRRAILAAALFPLLIRGLMLPWFPPPKPIVHDEFSYLLQADTFAHGRLANETPPYWQHFETEYTLLNPTYASQYQPAQGIVLAAGQVLAGHPWWGVWLSVGMMCGTFCWALSRVIPVRWALFGALAAALQFGIFGIWMNSYFGGALSATAGALVLGSLAGLKDTRKWKASAMVCAFGIVLLFATRPFEALLWSVCAVAYTAWFRRTRGAVRPILRELVAPFAVIFLIGAACLAFYNWRLTGNPWNPPYLAYQHVYGTPQPYWWQPPVTVRSFNYPELRDNYLNQLRLYQARYSFPAIIQAELARLRDFWRFFIGPFLTPALLFIGFVAFRDRRIRPWLLISLLFIFDKATYHAWFPAHNGPATVLIVLIVVQCWRHLYSWQRERKLGMGVSRALMAAFALAVFLGGTGRALEPIMPYRLRHIPPIWESLYPVRRLRDDVTQELERVPGKHLVFVRYAPGHCFCDEWVFNTAELKNQRVVYVRPFTPESDDALVRSFRDFDVWVVEPDSQPYYLARVNDIAALY